MTITRPTAVVCITTMLFVGSGYDLKFSHSGRFLEFMTRHFMGSRFRPDARKSGDNGSWNFSGNTMELRSFARTRARSSFELHALI